MHSFSRRFAALTGAVLLILCVSIRAQDDKTAAKPTPPAAPDKSAEAAPPADSTTQGSVTVGGQAPAPLTGLITGVGIVQAKEQPARLLSPT